MEDHERKQQARQTSARWHVEADSRIPRIPPLQTLGLNHLRVQLEDSYRVR
jgi:hypothetical protein